MNTGLIHYKYSNWNKMLYVLHYRTMLVCLAFMYFTYFPVFPSQILMDLSKEALAMRRVSGEKSTSLTRAWWPVRRATGFLSSAGFHKNMVKSSDPETSLSWPSPCRRAQGQVYTSVSSIIGWHLNGFTHSNTVVALQSLFLDLLHWEKTHL